MINKQNIWYAVLFSLIIVLCVYYIAMPDNISLKNTIDSIKDTNDLPVTSEISESSELVSLRIDDNEDLIKQMNSLQEVLLDENANIEEKNSAYEEMLTLNSNKGKEEDLENIILKDFGYSSFVKINNDNISIVIEKAEHNSELANNIIRRIQKEFDIYKYITVKFQ